MVVSDWGYSSCGETRRAASSHVCLLTLSSRVVKKVQDVNRQDVGVIIWEAAASVKTMQQKIVVEREIGA